MAAAAPPGWPRPVPPPGTPGWQDAAAEWLLDCCPADYRGYDAWCRHPVALAWIATRHVAAQVQAMREAYRQARVELGTHLDAAALADVLAALEREGLRLRADAHACDLVAGAFQGRAYVPRL